MEKIINGVEYLITTSTMGKMRASVQDLIVSERSRTKVFTIPATVEGIPVVEILQDAFQDAYWLERVNLPHTMCSIGPGAFDNCIKLKEVSIACRNTQVDIHRNAFSRCHKLERIKMNYDSVICLKGPGIFKDCDVLKILPPITGSIPAHTFLRCGLKIVNILGNVYLDSESFTHCNLDKIYCDKLEGINGDYTPFEKIQIIASEISDIMEYLVYNGYPSRVEELPIF